LQSPVFDEGDVGVRQGGSSVGHNVKDTIGGRRGQLHQRDRQGNRKDFIIMRVTDLTIVTRRFTVIPILSLRTSAGGEAIQELNK
jgi:hypothetical protein